MWNKYPTEDLASRGDKVVQSNARENLAIIAIIVLALVVIGGVLALFW